MTILGKNNDHGKRKEDELLTQQLGSQATTNNNNNNNRSRDVAKKETTNEVSQRTSVQPLPAQGRRNIQDTEVNDQSESMQHEENVQLHSANVLCFYNADNNEGLQNLDVGDNINFGASIGAVASYRQGVEPDSEGFVPISQQQVFDISKHHAQSSAHRSFGNSGICMINRFDTLEGLEKEKLWVPQYAASL